MVSQASVNAKIAYGFARSAAALGAACPWYRPLGTGNPLANRIGTVQAGFQMPNTAYTTPSNWTKPAWWGLFDTTNVRPGDYLMEPALGTFFVASIEPLHYPLCVSCSTVLTITRPTNPTPSATYYGGASVPLSMAPADMPTGSVIATSWPASVQNGTKGEKSDLQLPGDTRAPWVAILLPPSFPAQIVTGDVATTDHDIPLRYTISAAELSGLGWRITAALAVP